jgi:FMN phosphatase YigB (HAD superfamily)
MSKGTTPLRERHLPLWSKVVFVDWNGVLSREPFWRSILLNRQHPYHQTLSDACRSMFQTSRDFVREWMRGRVTAQQVVASLDVELDRRARGDYLLRKLFHDCSKMTCEAPVIAALQDARTNCFIVLATDNMDCFTQGMHRIKDMTDTVDAILCSSSIGVLKSDSIERFFGAWLADHQLSFANAILLDDCAATCDAFVRAGGHAVVVNNITDAVGGLREWTAR